MCSMCLYYTYVHMGRSLTTVKKKLWMAGWHINKYYSLEFWNAMWLHFTDADEEINEIDFSIVLDIFNYFDSIRCCYNSISNNFHLWFVVKYIHHVMDDDDLTQSMMGKI